MRYLGVVSGCLVTLHSLFECSLGSIPVAPSPAHPNFKSTLYIYVASCPATFGPRPYRSLHRHFTMSPPPPRLFVVVSRLTLELPFEFYAECQRKKRRASERLMILTTCWLISRHLTLLRPAAQRAEPPSRIGVGHECWCR